MSTAAPVPETALMAGETLSADNALATLRHVGSYSLVRDAFIRFRYGDGFSHARALALQFCLSFIPLGIAVVGLAATLGQHTLGTVASEVVLRLTPGQADVVDDVVRQTQSRSEESGQVALWLGLAAALVSLTTAMAQVERGANRIYGIQRDRPTTRKYGHALLLTFAAGLPALLGVYVAKTDTFRSTYGPLTSVLALLIWANLTAVALLLGVAVCAQIEAVRAGAPPPTKGRRATSSRHRR